MAFYLAMTPFNMWSAREHTSQSMQTPSAWGLGAHASAHESRTVQRRASRAAYRMRFYSPSSRRHRRRFDTGACGCGKLQLSFTYCAGDSLQYIWDYGAPLRPAVSCGTAQWPPAGEFRCTRPSWLEEGGRVDESQGFQGGVSGRPRLWRASGQPVSSVGSNLKLIAGLLLLSYPLHPIKQSTPLRTDHFLSLRTPAMFVHASKDPFGTPDELRSALDAIQATTRIVLVENARHELLTDNNTDTLPGVVVSEFRGFFGPRTKAA